MNKTCKGRYFAMDCNTIDTYSNGVCKICSSNEEAAMYANRYNRGEDAPKREETADDSGWEEDSFGYNYNDWN